MAAETSTLMSTQNADNVAITGGTIAGTTLTTQTITSPTISSPTISGTVAGTPTYTAGTFTSPTVGSGGAIFNGSSSGTTTLKAAATAAGTLTMPAITGTMSSTTGSNLDVVDVYQCTAPVTANNTTTYATVTGLSGTVVIGVYRFRAVLPSTVASGTGGIKYAFHYTNSAALSALEATGIGYTASAVAVQHTTTTTDVTDMFTQAAVVIMTIIEGTFTVSTGGTISLQMAQNTANASNTIALLGGSLEFCRIS